MDHSAALGYVGVFVTGPGRDRVHNKQYLRFSGRCTNVYRDEGH